MYFQTLALQYKTGKEFGRIFARELVAQLDGVLNALAVCGSNLTGCPPGLLSKVPVGIVRQQVGEFSACQLLVADFIADSVFLFGDLLHDRC